VDVQRHVAVSTVFQNVFGLCVASYIQAFQPRRKIPSMDIIFMCLRKHNRRSIKDGYHQLTGFQVPRL
jgi:hypothetical protein